MQQQLVAFCQYYDEQEQELAFFLSYDERVSDLLKIGIRSK